MNDRISHENGLEPWTLASHLPPVKLSFELFPPNSVGAAIDLQEELTALSRLRPEYFSVTSGAGGSSNRETFAVIEGIRQDCDIPVAAHLTCVGRTRAEISRLADLYWNSGIKHIVALRGDRPNEPGPDQPASRAYAHANDLVEDLKKRHDFKISVACYPEAHPESASAEADLDNLRRKVDAGANDLIGQYCFDTETILRFRDKLAAAGIDKPFAPGIMPILNFRQISRFSQRCGASIPPWLASLFEDVEPGTKLHTIVAATVASEQCRRLVAEGFDHLHIYALNRSELPRAIARLLKPVAQPAIAA